MPIFGDSASILRPGKGTLAETPFSALLNAVAVTRRTCALELSQPPLEKRIYFENGAPVACTSNVANEAFAKYLVDKEVLSEAKAHELLALSANKRVKLEQLLVQKEVLTAIQLQRHLQANLGRKLLDCFRWVGARWRLVGAGESSEVPQHTNPAQIIYTGVCTALPAEAVKAGLPFPPEQRFALVHQPPHSPSELKLAVRDEFLVMALQRRPTVDETIEATGMIRDDVLRRIYALAALEMLDLAERVSETPPPPAVVQAPALAPVAAVPPGIPVAVTTKAAVHVPEDESVGRAQRRRRAIGRGALAATVLFAVVGAVLALRPQPPPRVASPSAPVAPVARPTRPFVKPPPLPPPPSLPEKGSPAPRRPRGLELSASGLRLALPEAGDGPENAALTKGAKLLAAADAEEALRQFTKVAAAAPSEPEAWYGQALALYGLHRDEEALGALGHLFEASAAHPMGHLLAGFLELRAKQGEKARGHFQEYLKAEPAAPYAAEVGSIVAQVGK